MRIVKNKNKIFPKFLSPYPASSYKNPASKVETFFGSNLHTRLIIEGVFWNLPSIGAHLLLSLPSDVLTCSSAGGRGPSVKEF